MYGHTYSKSIDQPGKVANPARGQLNRENEYSGVLPCPRSRLRIWSRETSLAVPPRVSLLIPIPRLSLVLTCGIHPEFRGGFHLFTVFKTAIHHRVSPEFINCLPMASLPRVRRHSANKPQGSSKRVLPWQVTMDQLICASHSDTHYCV